MSTFCLSSSPLFRLLLLAALLLAQTQQALSAKFLLTASLANGVFSGEQFSVAYGLILTGEQAFEAFFGLYNITGASGTRTFDNGVDNVTTVSIEFFAGLQADNLLYYTSAAQSLVGGTFFDGQGLGQLQHRLTRCSPARTACLH